MSGLGEDSFSPGLRVAFVEYCKMPVGQGRLHPFDPSAPKMSQSQFIKLLQDIGVAEPEGSVPISSISVVFASFKPLGGSRMLFPHFFRALGAISSEARQDVIQMVSALGSRAVDLQYLSSIRLFPDKQFPYVLSKGDVGTVYSSGRPSNNPLLKQAGSVPPPRPGPGGPVGLVQRPPGSAPQAFGTSGNVVPLPRAVPSPREVWRSGEFVPPQQQQAGGEVDGHPPSHAHDGYPPIQARALASQPDSSPSPESPSRATYGSTHITPANHRQLEAWGAWEPPRDNDGKVPGWLNYMFNKMEFLEAGLRNMAGKGLSEADKEALARGIEHTCTTTCVAAANDIVRPVVAHAMSLETQVAEALAKLDALTPLHGKLAAAVELNDKVQRIETNIGSVQTAVHDMSSQFNGDVSRIIAMVGMVSDQVHRVTDGQLPAMEDELKKLKGLDVAMVDALTKRVEVLEATAMRHDEELQALRAQLAQDAERLRTEMELNMAELRTNITTNTDSLKSNVEVNINEMHASIAANHDSLRAATAGTAEELRTELAISAEAANRDVAELQRLLQSSIAAHEQLAAKVASEELRNEELRKLVAASTGRLSEDAAVDRAGLLTTTNLVEQTCTALESLKAQVAALEKQTSTSDANPESLLQRLDAQEQKMVDIVADVTAMSASLADLKDKELVAMQQRLVLVEESDAAYSLSLKELQPAIPELQATAASLKARQAGLDTRISGLEASMPRLLASVSDMEASVAGAAEKQETLAASVASVADKQLAVDAAVAAAADKQAAMEATITSVADKQAAVDAAVAAAADKQAAIEATITSVADKQAAVDAAVAAAADKQAAMEATIAGLAGKSGEVAEAVAGLGSRVADMDSRMTGRTAAVSEPGPPAETLEHSVAAMSSGEGLPAIISKLSELEGAFTEMKQALEGSLAAVQGTVQDMQGGMAAVQGTVAALQGNVAEVQGGFAAMQGTIQEVQGGMAAVQGSVAEVQGSVKDMQGSMVTLQGSVQDMEGGVAAMQSTVQEVQGSLAAVRNTVLPEVQQAAVGNEQAIKNLEETAAGLQQSVDANLKRVLEDAAVDRAQVLGASTLIGQVFESLELLKPDVAASTSLGSTLKELLTAVARTKDLASLQPLLGLEADIEGGAAGMTPDSVTSSALPAESQIRPEGNVAQAAELQALQAQMEGMKQQVQSLLEGVSKQAEDDEARHKSRLAELESARKDAKVALLTAVKAEQQAAADKLGSEMQALAAQLSSEVQALAARLEKELSSADTAHDDLVGATAVTAQAGVVAAMAARLEGIERVLGVPVGSEAQAAAAAGEAVAAPGHTGSGAGSSAQDTAGSSSHGTDSGQGGQADASRAMGTAGLSTANGVMTSDAAPDGSATGTGGSSPGGEQRGTSAQPAGDLLPSNVLSRLSVIERMLAALGSGPGADLLDARHNARIAELENARKEAKVALLTAVKAEQQAAADKLGSEMQTLAAQLSSEVQALAARLEGLVPESRVQELEAKLSSAATVQDDLVGASAATAQAEVVAAMATRLEGIERVLGVPVGSEAQAVAAAGKAGAAPDHAGSAAGSSAQDTAGSSGHGTDSGQGGQADGSRAMGTVGSTTADAVGISDAAPDGSATGTDGSSQGGEQRGTSAQPAGQAIAPSADSAGAAHTQAASAGGPLPDNVLGRLGMIEQLIGILRSNPMTADPMANPPPTTHGARQAGNSQAAGQGPSQPSLLSRIAELESCLTQQQKPGSGTPPATQDPGTAGTGADGRSVSAQDSAAQAAMIAGLNAKVTALEAALGQVPDTAELETLPDHPAHTVLQRLAELETALTAVAASAVVPALSQVDDVNRADGETGEALRRALEASAELANVKNDLAKALSDISQLNNSTAQAQNNAAKALDEIVKLGEQTAQAQTDAAKALTDLSQLNSATAQARTDAGKALTDVAQLTSALAASQHDASQAAAGLAQLSAETSQARAAAAEASGLATSLAAKQVQLQDTLASLANSGDIVATKQAALEAVLGLDGTPYPTWQNSPLATALPELLSASTRGGALDQRPGAADADADPALLSRLALLESSLGPLLPQAATSAQPGATSGQADSNSSSQAAWPARMAAVEKVLGTAGTAGQALAPRLAAAEAALAGPNSPLMAGAAAPPGSYAARLAALEEALRGMRETSMKSSDAANKAMDAMLSANLATSTEPPFGDNTDVRKTAAAIAALDGVGYGRREDDTPVTCILPGPAGSEVIRVKYTLGGLLDALDDSNRRISELELLTAGLNTAVSQLRTANLEANMRMLQGTRGQVDDTVASQAELDVVRERLQQLDATVTEYLNSSMGAGINNGMVMVNGMLGSAMSVPAMSGMSVASTTNSQSLKTVNPHRDKLAAAILEVDKRVDASEASLKAMKATQDTFKSRLNDMAEALVSVSTKVQARIAKMENGKGREGGDDVSTLDDGARSLQSANTATPGGLSRLLGKRMDDFESRLSKAELEAGRGVRVQISKEIGALVQALNEMRQQMGLPLYEGSAMAAAAIGPGSAFPGLSPQPSQLPYPSAAGAEELAALEADLQGLGKDVVALHSMMQQTEEALRHAILEECVPRGELQQLEERLDEKLAIKEEVILRLARQIDLLGRKLPPSQA